MVKYCNVILYIAIMLKIVSNCSKRLMMKNMYLYDYLNLNVCKKITYTDVQIVSLNATL